MLYTLWWQKQSVWVYKIWHQPFSCWVTDILFKAVAAGLSSLCSHNVNSWVEQLKQVALSALDLMRYSCRLMMLLVRLPVSFLRNSNPLRNHHITSNTVPMQILHVPTIHTPSAYTLLHCAYKCCNVLHIGTGVIAGSHVTAFAVCCL